MASHTRRRALQLAQDTRDVTRHARARSGLSVMDLVEHQLARRAEHAAAIAFIDGELKRVFERLAGDYPAVVPPSPQPRADAAGERSSVAVTPVSTPAARALRVPRAGGVTEEIRRVLAQTSALSREIYAALADLPRERVKHALSAMVDAGELLRTGKTTNTRYTLRPESSVADLQAPKPVRRVEGEEFEVVWSGRKDDASLLGDRDTRGSVLAGM